MLVPGEEKPRTGPLSHRSPQVLKVNSCSVAVTKATASHALHCYATAALRALPCSVSKLV